MNIINNRWREIFLLLPGLMSGRSGADSLLLLMQQQADRHIDTSRLTALFQWANNVTGNSRRKSKPSVQRVGAIFLTLALVLARDLARARDLSLSRDLGFALELAINRALVLSRTLDLDLTTDLVRALELARTRAIALDRDFARDLARGFERTGVFCGVDFEGLVQSFEQIKNNQYNQEVNRDRKESFTESAYSLWFSALGVDSNTADLTPIEVQSLAHYFYIYELIVRCKEGATRISPNVWEDIESSILTVPASHNPITN